MLPTSSFKNVLNCGFGTAKSSCYFALTFPFLTKAPDLYNIFLPKNSFLMKLPFGPNFGMSIFFDHVASVIRVASNEKMFRINAFWIVARMKHKHFFGYRAMGYLPRQPMSQHPLVRRNMDFSIPIVVQRSSPFPALIALSNFFPKSLVNVGHKEVV